MMRRTTFKKLAAVVLVMISFSNFTVFAKSNVVAVDGVAYNTNVSMQTNLKALVGKKVSLTLRSGQVITGKVKSVGQHLVHIEKLDRKDFFDALVKIKKVDAIDTRFREIKR